MDHVIPLFEPARVPRHRRRRRPQLPSAGPLAHVTSVFANGSSIAVWTFDRPVVAIVDASGLACPASGAVVTANVAGPNTVNVEYESDVFGGGGDTWECTAADVEITFGGGGGGGGATLQDGTGFISGS